MNKANIFSIIPARAGSKGIEKKNIKLLNGKPLINYTIEASIDSKYIDYTYISTDIDDIKSFVKKYSKIVIYNRPKSLAADDSLMKDVIKDTLNFIYQKNTHSANDILVLLQPTSPLRTSEDIDRALELFISSKEATSLVSVMELNHKYTSESVMLLKDGYLNYYKTNDKIEQNRQNKKKYFSRNGSAIYIVNINEFLKQDNLITKKCIPFIMPAEKSIDIDTPFDFLIAELLIKNNIG